MGRRFELPLLSGTTALSISSISWWRRRYVSSSVSSLLLAPSPFPWGRSPSGTACAVKGNGRKSDPNGRVSGYGSEEQEGGGIREEQKKRSRKGGGDSSRGPFPSFHPIRLNPSSAADPTFDT